MKTIENRGLLQEYIKRYHVNDFFPQHYFDDLQLVELKRGESICCQGQPLEGLYFFLEGRIKVVRALVNGKENILTVREDACILGEVELMTGRTFVSSVVALKNSYAIRLMMAGHKERLLRDASFLFNVSRTLAEKMYQLDISGPVNVAYSVKERLAMHLLSMEDAPVFSLDLSTLADLLGTSYRHLLRVLNQFVEEGVLIKENRKYRIIDAVRLNGYATEHDVC